MDSAKRRRFVAYAFVVVASAVGLWRYSALVKDVEDVGKDNRTVLCVLVFPDDPQQLDTPAGSDDALREVIEKARAGQEKQRVLADKLLDCPQYPPTTTIPKG